MQRVVDNVIKTQQKTKENIQKQRLHTQNENKQTKNRATRIPLKKPEVKSDASKAINYVRLMLITRK